MYEDDLYDETGKRNPMASASIALGIAALLSCAFFYIALPCGALAILCAILSRSRSRMSGKGKAGMICGIIGMVVTVIITGAALRTLLNDAQMRSNMELYLQYYLDDPQFSLDDMLGTLFPGFSASDNEDSSSGIAVKETEDESETADGRVHLRVAPDEEETELAPASETKPDTKTDASEDADETEQTEIQTESESKEKEIEQPEQRPEDDSSDPTPRGGGSFI